MNSKIDDICKALNVLSNIKKDHKLLFPEGLAETDAYKQKVIIQEPCLWTSLSRSMSIGRATQKETADYIEYLYTETFEQLNILREQRHLHLPADPNRQELSSIENEIYMKVRNQFGNLVSFLENSLIGLNNLILTYPENSQLKFFQNKIENTELKKHKSLLTTLDDYMLNIRVLIKPIVPTIQSPVPSTNPSTLSSTHNNINNAEDHSMYTTTSTKKSSLLGMGLGTSSSRNLGTSTHGHNNNSNNSASAFSSASGYLK